MNSRASAAPAQTVALVALYASQGLSYGFFGWILIPNLTAAGVGLSDQAGLFALAGLPWLLKWVWAPALDFARIRLAGRTWAPHLVRATIALGSLAVGLSAWRLSHELVDLANIDLTALRWLWLAQNLGLTLQDVATDAHVVERVEPRARARVQAGMLWGHKAGSEIAAGVILGGLVARYSLSFALGLQATATLLVVFAPLLLANDSPAREHPRGEAEGEAEAEAERAQVHSSTGWPITSWARAILFAATCMLMDVLTSTVAGIFLVQRLAWTPAEIAETLTWAAFAGASLGFIASAKWVDLRVSLRSLRAACVALGTTTLAFAASEILWGSHVWIATLTAIQSFAMAVYATAVHAWLLGLCSTKLGATSFVGWMTLLNAPRAIAPMVAPALLDGLGFVGFFACAGAFQVVLVGTIPAIAGRR